MKRVALVGEQPSDIHIGTLRQRYPDDLKAEGCDADGIGAGESQNGTQGIVLRNSRIEQQGFLVQDVSSVVLGVVLLSGGVPGGGGAAKGLR